VDVDAADVASLMRVREGIYADDLLLAGIVRLDLLTVLADDPGTLDDLCIRHGIAHRPADVLCTLLRAMGLLEPGAVLRPTPLARSCLIRGAPFDLRPYLASGASRATCLEQVEVLRTGQPAAWTGGRAGVWPHDPAVGELLTLATDARARVLAPLVADALDDLPFHSLLEIGGSGACAGVMADRRHDLNFAVLEPRVAGIPRPSMLAAPELDGRVTVTASGPCMQVPGGYDLHLLSHALHCWNERGVRQIVGRSYDSLLPGGWIVDVDAHLNADRTGPLSVARYAVLVLYATEGQCWSVGELTGFLQDAGFLHVEERAAGPDRTAILAQKPRG
jgi:hypothetical protein